MKKEKRKKLKDVFSILEDVLVIIDGVKDNVKNIQREKDVGSNFVHEIHSCVSDLQDAIFILQEVVDC